MRADSAAPPVVAAWADELVSGVIGAQLRDATFQSPYGKRNFRSALESILAGDDLAWCGAKGCAAQSSTALSRALDWLEKDQGREASQWKWGRAHDAISIHKYRTGQSGLVFSSRYRGHEQPMLSLANTALEVAPCRAGAPTDAQTLM